MAGVGRIVRFDYEIARKVPLTNYGEISEEKMWDNLTYFLKAVIPVAEEAGVKMAMHPADPQCPALPVSPELSAISKAMTGYSK